MQAVFNKTPQVFLNSLPAHLWNEFPVKTTATNLTVLNVKPGFIQKKVYRRESERLERDPHIFWAKTGEEMKQPELAVPAGQRCKCPLLNDQSLVYNYWRLSRSSTFKAKAYDAFLERAEAQCWDGNMKNLTKQTSFHSGLHLDFDLVCFLCCDKLKRAYRERLNVLLTI